MFVTALRNGDFLGRLFKIRRVKVYAERRLTFSGFLTWSSTDRPIGVRYRYLPKVDVVSEAQGGIWTRKTSTKEVTMTHLNKVDAWWWSESWSKSDGSAGFGTGIATEHACGRTHEVETRTMERVIWCRRITWSVVQRANRSVERGVLFPLPETLGGNCPWEWILSGWRMRDDLS